MYLIGKVVAVSQEIFVTPQGAFNWQGSSTQDLFVTPQGVFNWLVRSTVNQNAGCRFSCGAVLIRFTEAATTTTIRTASRENNREKGGIQLH